ncbi:MAG: glycogen/starch synthase [candidate division KSB1 bacterium]|nr:glycogen/starch synthase [candidate division KSB1 bacterium]
MKEKPHIDWSKDWTLMPYFFDNAEINLIVDRLKHLQIETVAYCTYENRFAKSGGVGAVATLLPLHLKAADPNVDVIVLTPFHSGIIDERRVSPTHQHVSIEVGQHQYDVEILEHSIPCGEHGAVKEYYLKIDGFFNAQNRLNDPYIFHESDQDENDRLLLQNALIFCHAVPFALKALGRDNNIVFHLQDWQSALIALTSKLAMRNGVLRSCGSVITLHNVFDCFVPWESLVPILGAGTIERIERQFRQGLTALQLALPLVDAPITTVSQSFARELTTDILQAEYFAPHLQPLLQRSKLVGIPNGPFVPFPEEFRPEKQLTIQKIKEIKSRNRKALLQVLEQYHPAEQIGALTYQGGPISHLPDSVPIIAMTGRMDVNQKGYDIALQCFERFAPDEIKVVLTPLVSKFSHLDFLREAVSRCQGNVTMFPMRLEQGYQELLLGSSFGLMPSIYEPFGAALEYLVNGTVVLARKTGGLADQIQDQRCGLLYRETNDFYQIAFIRDYFAHSNDLNARRANPWSQSMVAALHEKLIEAIHLYQHHPEEYYRLIIMGFKQARSFDWSNAAQSYLEVYHQVAQGL